MSIQLLRFNSFRVYIYVQDAPTLVGHGGILIGDEMYVVGGYSEKLGFNQDLYIWHVECNEWSKIQGNGNIYYSYYNLRSLFYAYLIFTPPTFVQPYVGPLLFPCLLFYVHPHF